MSRNHDGVWDACLRVIKDNVSLQAYNTWFEPIVPVKLDADILTIQVPSHFSMSGWRKTTLCYLKK